MNLHGMSIVFLGSEVMGKTLEAYARHRAGHLWTATEVLQALAFYMFYMPDVVVLEDGANPELTNEVYSHLSSVGAQPLIILSGESEAEAWKDVSDETTLVLPRSTNGESLLAAIAETSARTPSWFKLQVSEGGPKGDMVIGERL